MSGKPDDTSLVRFPSQHELLTAVFRRWKVVCFCALLGLAYGVNVLHSETYLYRVQMIVTPAQRGSAPSAAGGFAALVNIALPSGGEGSDFNLYLDLLKSRNIADELAKDPKLMHTIYGAYWDEAKQSWHDVPETRRLQLATKRVRDFLGYPSVAWHAPDGETLLGFILYYVKIEQDPRKPYMAKVYMDFGNKEFATEFLGRLRRTADEMLRERAIKRTTDYIAYLSSTLSKVTVTEHRLALAQALSEQEKTAMVARSGAPFAADVLEAPWSASDPIYPQALQTLARWALSGALLGTALALFFWGVKRRWQARAVRRNRRLPLASDAISEQGGAEANAA